MAKIVSRGDPIEPVYLNNLVVADWTRGVFYGFAVSERGAGANMSIDVALGNAWIDDTRIIKTSTTNVAITAAHASYGRYDLVVINSSGTISVVDGTAAATSYANDYDLETNNAILLAEVYVPATYTTIEDAQITDKRIYIKDDKGALKEEYLNHLWRIDNTVETYSSGSGSSSHDVTNHEQDLSSGVGIGAGTIQTVEQYTPGTKSIICEFIVNNVSKGSGGTVRAIHVGFRDDFENISGAPYALIQYNYDTDEWRTHSYVSGSETNVISDIVSGDILKINLTTSSIKFYVNDSLVATHTSQLPTAVMNIGARVHTTTVTPTTAVTLSVDNIDIGVY